MVYRDVRNPILFEIAWEVANKVGGIYTVLKSKAPVTVHEYGDRYTLIGPLIQAYAVAEVEIEEVTNPYIKEILDEMTRQNVRWMYGRWLIEGSPRVLLLDTGSVADRLDSWKSDLWNVTGIPSPPNDQETNNAILFGYLVAWFLGDFVARERTKAVIAHFHEWLAGVAVTLFRKRRTDLTTIFTTHATLLGRYLCAGSVDFYNNINNFMVDEEAGKRGIYHRYCIERGASHCADVFTTVSQITAYEAENLLKRRPDGVLPNGLNIVKFSAMHEFQNLHAMNKERIHNFVRAGRYEYRNKGVDMFIESLARLNSRLKASNSPMTVVAFLIMPAATHSFTVESLKGQAVMKQLNETVKDITDKIGQRIFEKAARYAGGDINEAVIDPKELLTNEDRVLLKRRVIALKRCTLPPIVTHNMSDDINDPILIHLRRVKLFNHPSDRVKIVFHPEFINSNNPLFGLDYEDFVRGCHLGVFASYYEPWGYTPAECTVMGVPSITTNLSGFGCFMEEILENSSDYGIYIVDRRMKSVEESVQQLADNMLEFCQKSRRQRINQRNRTERLSDILDWKLMGMEYVRARNLALHRAYPDSFAGSELSDFQHYKTKIPKPLSAPGSPRIRGSNLVDVDDITDGITNFDSSNPLLPNQVINMESSKPFIKLPFPPLIDTQQLILNSKKKSCARNNSHVPLRAPNAFIIYRKVFVEAVKSEGHRLPMTVISSMASRSWENETDVVKEEYKRLSREAYNRFNEMFPKKDGTNRRKKREVWNLVSFDKQEGQQQQQIYQPQFITNMNNILFYNPNNNK
ncbi:1567_t:CDS:10 [Entrophospora sp. SA101]|nr:1567_t:CDS:10 [Entrophospora sp. SA101]